MKLKFSVIMPVYNLEDYVLRAINSVLVQNYKNIELIIVDDGSIDKTKVICQNAELKDTRVKYIYQSNHGVASARNHGMRVASGDYIMFLDGDDKLHNANVIKKVNEILNEAKYDLLIGNTIVVNKDKKSLNDTKSQIGITSSDSFIDLITKYVDKGVQPPWWSYRLVIKRTVINKYKFKFNSETSNAEDALFFFTLAKKITNYKITDLVLCDYIIRNTSITHTLNFKNVYDALKNFSTIYNSYNFEKIKQYISECFMDYIPAICRLNKNEQQICYKFVENNSYIIDDYRGNKTKYRMYKFFWKNMGMKNGNKINSKIHDMLVRLLK